MKKLITLAALSTLAVNAQAQAPIAIDGQITPAEIVAGGYTLVGTYTGPRGFSPSATNQAGLLALYAAADANNIYFFLAGTLQNDATPATISNSFQILIGRPGVAGVPVGVQLPKPVAATAPAVNTSFQNFAPYLELPGDIGIGIKGNGVAAQYQVDGVVYTGGTTPAASATVLSGATGVAATGAVAAVTAQTGAFVVFNGTQVAYRTSTSLNTNPGFASNGQVPPANGLEVAISRASANIPAAGGALRVFALQNNADGGFVSTDFIPQSGSNTTNLGTNPDFRTIAGTQAATVNIGAGTGVTVLGTKAADANALALQVYPNPATSIATLDYNVGSRADNVNIMLTDLMGRNIKSLVDGLQPAGKQSTSVSTANVAAGTYLVRVQVGDKISTRKVVLL
ncbi:T9SS type A sorting domain-containing protein [Hymenobacter glaciei]